MRRQFQALEPDGQPVLRQRVYSLSWISFGTFGVSGEGRTRLRRQDS